MNDEFQHSEAKSNSKNYLNKIRNDNLSDNELKNIISEAKKNEDNPGVWKEVLKEAKEALQINIYKRNNKEKQKQKEDQELVKKIMDRNYALHYKRLAQIYINFDQFKNLFLGIKKSREDVEKILKNAQPLPTSSSTAVQPKQPWEDWDNGQLQLSKDGDMVSVKGHVYIRVGNRYEPFNTSTATLYTQDGCLSGSWSLAAKDDQEYKYVSHTEAVKRQMNRQVFYTGQELEDIKQKLKTRYRDAIRMRFVNEFLSNKDRLFKDRCVKLFESDPDNEKYKHYDLVDYEKIDPLYNRNLVAEKSNMLRAKEAIVRVEFNCCDDVRGYDQKRDREETKRKEDEQRRQGVEQKENIQNRRNEKQKIVSKQRQDEKDRQKQIDEDIEGDEDVLSKALGGDFDKNEKEIEFKPTETMFASDSESEAPKEIDLQESDVESEAFVEESKTVEEESKESEAPKEIDLQESEEESKTVEEESKEVEAPKEIELQESKEVETKTVEAPKEVVRVDSPMSDDDLMRLMKDDRVLDMLDGLSDSESVREMSMSESDQEVREVKVFVDSDSDKEFSFAASTSEDDTLTSMMQNMDAFASDEEDEEEVKWASTSSGAD